MALLTSLTYTVIFLTAGENLAINSLQFYVSVIFEESVDTVDTKGPVINIGGIRLAELYEQPYSVSQKSSPIKLFAIFSLTLSL